MGAPPCSCRKQRDRHLEIGAPGEVPDGVRNRCSSPATPGVHWAFSGCAGGADPVPAPDERAFGLSGQSATAGYCRPIGPGQHDADMAESDDQPPAGDPPPAEPKTRGRPFVKGAGSPNPGGRPKTAALARELIRRAGPTAVRDIVRIARDPATSRRLRAEINRWLVEQLVGRPVTSIAASMESSPGGASAEGALEALISRLAGGGAAAEPQRSTTPEIAPPSASGDDRRGLS